VFSRSLRIIIGKEKFIEKCVSAINAKRQPGMHFVWFFCATAFLNNASCYCGSLIALKRLRRLLTFFTVCWLSCVSSTEYHKSQSASDSLYDFGVI